MGNGDDYYGGKGATTTAAGCNSQYTSSYCGSLGAGANGSGTHAGGGGSGHYGGGGATSYSGGGGGSGYVGSLTSPYNIAGNLTTVPNFVGGYMTGKQGTGYVKITKVS